MGLIMASVHVGSRVVRWVIRQFVGKLGGDQPELSDGEYKILLGVTSDESR